MSASVSVRSGARKRMRNAMLRCPAGDRRAGVHVEQLDAFQQRARRFGDHALGLLGGDAERSDHRDVLIHRRLAIDRAIVRCAAQLEQRVQIKLGDHRPAEAQAKPLARPGVQLAQRSQLAAVRPA